MVVDEVYEIIISCGHVISSWISRDNFDSPTENFRNFKVVQNASNFFPVGPHCSIFTWKHAETFDFHHTLIKLSRPAPKSQT